MSRVPEWFTEINCSERVTHTDDCLFHRLVETRLSDKPLCFRDFMKLFYGRTYATDLADFTSVYCKYMFFSQMYKCFLLYG